VPEFTIGIQVLHIGIHDVGGLNGLARLERFIDCFAALEILDTDTVERLSFAWLDEFVLNNDAGISVDEDAEP
jgi:hypothetical protein